MTNNFIVLDNSDEYIDKKLIFIDRMIKKNKYIVLPVENLIKKYKKEKEIYQRIIIVIKSIIFFSTLIFLLPFPGQTKEFEELENPISKSMIIVLYMFLFILNLLKPKLI